MYPDVSRAYFEAVHGVLMRKQSAAQAADELERHLTTMLKTSAVTANGTSIEVSRNGASCESEAQSNVKCY
jgi:hypothetical protein